MAKQRNLVVSIVSPSRVSRSIGYEEDEWW